MFYKQNNSTDALKFIREFAISTGTEPIRTTTIYYAYCKWKISGKKQSRKKFIKDFSSVFKIYKNGRYRYADLSNFPKHLQTTKKEERYFLQQSYLVRHGKKKKQQKIKSEEKISRTKSTSES